METPVNIRWRDLDAFGHVNQAVYLTYAEEVLDAWFRRMLSLDDSET
jgi:acyl-CoA thioester hydrolase